MYRALFPSPKHCNVHYKRVKVCSHLLSTPTTVTIQFAIHPRSSLNGDTTVTYMRHWRIPLNVQFENLLIVHNLHNALQHILSLISNCTWMFPDYSYRKLAWRGFTFFFVCVVVRVLLVCPVHGFTHFSVVCLCRFRVSVYHVHVRFVVNCTTSNKHTIQS